MCDRSPRGVDPEDSARFLGLHHRFVTAHTGARRTGRTRSRTVPHRPRVHSSATCPASAHRRIRRTGPVMTVGGLHVRILQHVFRRNRQHAGVMLARLRRLPHERVEVAKSEMTVGKACGARTAWTRLMATVWVLSAAVADIAVSAPPGSAPTNRPAPSGVATTTLQEAWSLPLSSGFRRSGPPPRSANPKVSGPTCTFNGSSGPIITVFPGASVAIACTG